MAKEIYELEVKKMPFKKKVKVWLCSPYRVCKFTEFLANDEMKK